MHIVFLTNEYPKNDESHGGIGTFVQNLARNLIKKNSSVSVVGISNNHLDETEIDEGVVIYRLPKSGIIIMKSKELDSYLKDL